MIKYDHEIIRLLKEIITMIYHLGGDVIMAQKICFIVSEDNIFEEKMIEFEYIKGMAFSQKQKNVLSFHKSIKELYEKNILEVSTKSNVDLGVKLSAFNLKLDGYYFESVFQSSKVFEGNRQYGFLMRYPPKEAKKYMNANPSGNLIAFQYKNKRYDLNPKSMFYDYLYIQALQQHPNISKQIIQYDIFTDIEYNYKKQVNCQARACAIYCYLLRHNVVDYYLSDINHFKLLYKNNHSSTQLSLFEQ